MKTELDSFQVYLRGEVDAAGKSYDASVTKIFDILNTKDTRPGLELASAVEAMSENLRLYSGAIRRMSRFTAQQ